MTATTGTVVVREVRPEDAERLGAAVAAAYVRDALLPADDPYVEVLRDVAGRLPDVVAVLAAYDGEEVLGGLTLVEAGTSHAEVALPGELEIRMLGVSPDHRRRGVAEALLRAAEERARAGGHIALVLSSMPAMTDAQRLYRRYGFVRVPDRDWLADWDPEALADGTAERLSVYRLPLEDPR